MNTGASRNNKRTERRVEPKPSIDRVWIIAEFLQLMGLREQHFSNYANALCFPRRMNYYICTFLGPIER